MNLCVASGHLRLRPLEVQDIEILRQWRNDKDLTRFLSPLPEITPAMQEAWYVRYTQDDTELIFVAEDTAAGEIPVGTIALSDIKDQSAVCGKFIMGNAAYRGKGYGGEMLRLCLRLAFERLQLQTCTCFAHPLNVPSLASWVNAGFQICDTRPFYDGGFEYCLRLTADRYHKLQEEAFV